MQRDTSEHYRDPSSTWAHERKLGDEKIDIKNLISFTIGCY